MKEPKNAAIEKRGDEPNPSLSLPTDPSSQHPPRRVVVLGASNVVCGLSTVVETAQLVLDGPVDFLGAIGFGRSYGMTSRVLGRSLPGILDCGLWTDLSSRSPAETYALVTDIGNDIVYGVDVEQIAEWVERCLERLAPVCRRIVVTELPLDSLSTLGLLRFGLFRALLFPGSRLSLKDAQSRSRSLNASVLELAERFGARVKPPKAEWTGLDPIHIRMRYWSRAWHEILCRWRDDSPSSRARGSFTRWLRLQRQRPHSRHLFGIHQRRAQPTCTMRDGSKISLY